MVLGKYSTSLAALAACFLVLSAGKVRGEGLDCGVGDMQVVLPAITGDAAKPQSPASAQAQVQIQCKRVPAQKPPAAPMALSTYPTDTPRGQVTWSSNNGKLTTGSDSRRLSIHNTPSVVIDSRGFTSR